MRRATRNKHAADPLAPYAEELLRRINKNKAVVIDYARYFGDEEAKHCVAARVVDIDSNGLTLSWSVEHAEDEELRVAFPKAIRSPGEAVAALNVLTREASQALGTTSASQQVDPLSASVLRFFPERKVACLTLLLMGLTFYLHWHPAPTPIKSHTIRWIRDTIGTPMVVSFAVTLIAVLHTLEAMAALIYSRFWKRRGWGETLAWFWAVLVFGVGSFSNLLADKSGTTV